MPFLMLEVSQFRGNQRAGLEGEGRRVSSDFGSSLTRKPVCAIAKHAGNHSAFIPGRWAVCEKKKFPSGLIQAASMVLHESCDECAESLSCQIQDQNKRYWTILLFAGVWFVLCLYLGWSRPLSFHFPAQDDRHMRTPTHAKMSKTYVEQENFQRFLNNGPETLPTLFTCKHSLCVCVYVCVCVCVCVCVFIHMNWHHMFGQYSVCHMLHVRRRGQHTLFIIFFRYVMIVSGRL